MKENDLVTKTQLKVLEIVSIIKSGAFKNHSQCKKFVKVIEAKLNDSSVIDKSLIQLLRQESAKLTSFSILTFFDKQYHSYIKQINSLVTEAFHIYNEDNNFLKLPKDIYNQISQFLTPWDLAKAERTCQTLNYNFFQARKLHYPPITYANFKQQSIFEGHDTQITALSIVKDGLVSGSIDGSIRLWDIKTGECIQIFPGHTQKITCLTILPNKQLASGSDDKTIKIWDLTSGECLQTLVRHTWPIVALTAMPNHTLVSSDLHDNILQWDLVTNHYKEIFIQNKNNDSKYSTIIDTCTLPNRRYFQIRLSNGLLARSSVLSPSSAYGAVDIWDIMLVICELDLRYSITFDGNYRSSLGNGNMANIEHVSTFVELPSGNVAAGFTNKHIIIWQIKQAKSLKAKIKHKLIGHNGNIIGLAALPNGHLFSASEDKCVKIWDTITGKCLETVELPIQNIQHFMMISPGIFAIAEDKLIKIWSFDTFQTDFNPTAEQNTIDDNTIQFSMN